MSAENISGLEYMANAQRLELTVKCLDSLRATRHIAAPRIVEYIDKAIAAAEGACYGYGYRDDELYREAQDLGIWSEIARAAQ